MESLPDQAPLLYPLPAILAALPFTMLPKAFAGAAFFGLSMALLAFGLLRDGWYRAPLLVGAPVFVAAWIVQWSPLVAAAAFLPCLLPLALVKPNLGLAIITAYPSRAGLLWVTVALAISLVILPTWPLDWLANLEHAARYLPVIAVWPGRCCCWRCGAGGCPRGGCWQC